MDAERSKKTRSLGTESKTSRQTSSTSHQLTKRPELGDRHNSAPLAAQRRQTNDKQLVGESETSGRTRRNPQAQIRYDTPSQPLSNIAPPQLFNRHEDISKSSSTFSQVSDQDDLPLITFAVVGTAETGKSTFIQNALNAQSPSPGSISQTRVRVGGLLYRLRLIETPRESVCLDGGKVLWPYTSDPDRVPDVNGVLYLYDMSDRDSLEGLPSLLTTLYEAEVTVCLVACKVDLPEDEYDIPTTFSARIKQRFPSILVGQSSSDGSDNSQHCLLKIVERSLGISAGHPPEHPKSDSHTNSHFPTRHSSITTPHTASSSSLRGQGNSRVAALDSPSRENSFTIQTLTVLESEDEREGAESPINETEATVDSVPKTPLRLVTRDLQTSLPSDPPYTPLSMTGPLAAHVKSVSKRGEAPRPNTPDSLNDTMETHERSYRTFLDMDDESVNGSPVDNVRSRLRKMSLEDGTPVEGVTFTDLVHRLLAAPTSKGDSKFIPSFLCLYRVFATPKHLLMAIIDAFVKMERSNLLPLTKTAELLRYLGVLGQWTMYYPGDFANASLWEMAVAFVSTVEKTKSYAAAAKQIANNLQTSTPDDDDDWTFSDASTTSRSRAGSTPHRSLNSAVQSKDNRYTRGQSMRCRDDGDGDDSDSNDDIATPCSPRHSATTSSASSIIKGLHVSSQTSDILHNLENARERAQKLRMIPHNQLSKTQWHQFMSYSTDELAIEITRIDWTVYSAIRLREFVRYAMVPSSQRAQAGQTDYIGVMTRHFNHLALFVAGMILLRDKPKHRAKMLEKFMDLAWKVRQLNNYHALGAIVAALNGEEIVRLSQTQELISQERHKQFLRLKILMGHQKSHAAYRMAWENSSGERIPFLPRVQEDLIKAATANPTFVGGQIKWSKFEVMGETLVGIQKSQDQSYVFPDRTARSLDIEKLILETKILESGENCADPQQELYERSKQVEPIPSGGERKKFDWLRR